MGGLDRYVSATHSSNLKVEERTTYSDSDMLGAMGLAAKRRPLAAALARLYAGHNHAVADVIVHLAGQLGRNRDAREWPQVQKDDLARAVIAWHRDGICKTCHGRGHSLLNGAPVLGAACAACSGTKWLNLSDHFRPRQLPVARWLLREVDEDLAEAGAVMHYRLR